MDGESNFSALPSWNARLNGTVEVTDLSLADCGVDQPIRERCLYTWRPPYQVQDSFPDWFEFKLECAVGTDGIRRFYFPHPLESGNEAGMRCLYGRPELVASIGGYYLLCDRGMPDQAQLLTYHEARLFLQYIGHSREYLGKRSRLEKAIAICAGGQAGRSNANILPEDLGLDSLGEGEVWSAARLREEGFMAARTAGKNEPDSAEILRRGMMAAARINPLILDASETLPVIRLLFFAFPGSDDPVTGEQMDYVRIHVKKSLEDHLDDSDEKFDEWIKDPKSNLLRRISKRSDCAMDREHVKKVLLELGWRSIQMLGRCVDTQFQAFRDAISDQLTPDEDFLFGQVFLANTIYGGLPSLLLTDRFEFLREAILNVWNERGNQKSVAILHRMMYYYTELIGNRREADRNYKRRAFAKNAEGRVASEHTHVPDWDEQRSFGH